MKLTVIGGASSYTPELIGGLYDTLGTIPVREVALMDPNRDRLAIIAALARRMGVKYGNPLEIVETDNLVEAVRGAAYVVTQIRVGGAQARVQDEKLGLRHNLIGQETTGIGGFACALRTIPRILDVAHAVEQHAPGATLINFTNPAGLITEAVLRHSPVRTVGLCNIPIGMIMDVAERTGCDAAGVRLDYVGLNHLSWVRGFTIDGSDRTPELLEHFIENGRKEWDVPAICAGMQSAMRRLRMFCNYYLQYYYCTEAALAHLKSKPRTRGEEVIELETSLFEKYRDPTLTEKPPELAKRGGAHYSTAALRLIEGIETDSGSIQIVSCRNGGAIPSLDNAAAVEVPAKITKAGAAALPQNAPESSISGLMQQIKAFEALTVQAAVECDRDAAYQAMLVHPLMPDATGIEPVLDELLEINRPYLPDAFFN